jgi:hypothetical protein
MRATTMDATCKLRIAFQAQQMQAQHLRKELESTRNAGDTPAMTLVADDAGRLAGREWFPPQTGFEAQPDEHGRDRNPPNHPAP